MTILEGLDRVDWSAVEHAYGPAVDTPRHLQALATGDAKARKAALAKLEETIHHQTETYPASAAAVPFLVSLVLDREYAERTAVLQLVAGLAVGDSAPVAREGFDVRSRAGRGALDVRDGGMATYAAVASELARMAALLRDPDVAVRRAAPFVFGIFVDRAVETLPRFREVLAAEDDAFARASLLLALRFLAVAAKDRSDVAALDERVARGTPADVDACAAAIARLAVGGRDEAALGLLARQKATKKSPGFGWGDLRSLAKWVIDGLDLDKPVDELCAELEAGADPERAYKILVRVLPELLPPHQGSHWLPSELSPLARRTLEAAAKHGYIQSTAFSAFFASRGIPPYKEHRLWLGIDPPGLLERVAGAGGRSWPVWKWIHAAVKGELAPNEAVEAVAAHLTEAERLALVYPASGPLALYRYELLCAYDASGPEDTVGRQRGEDALNDVLASILSTCAFGALRDIAEELVVNPRKFVNFDALIIALGRVIHARHEGFPETLLPLWEHPRLSRLLRDGFATLPLATREQLLQRGSFGYEPILVQTPSGPREDVALLRGWTVMDLCPTAWTAEYTVNAVLHFQGPADGVLQLGDILVHLGRVACPAIDAALADKKQNKNPYRGALVEARRRLEAS